MTNLTFIKNLRITVRRVIKSVYGIELPNLNFEMTVSDETISVKTEKSPTGVVSISLVWLDMTRDELRDM